jgi:hypothetical protein
MSLEMKYFVLKPKAKGKNDLFARASQEAMIRFADIIRDLDDTLATELYSWADREDQRQRRLAL